MKSLTRGQLEAVLNALDGKQSDAGMLAEGRRKLREGLQARVDQKRKKILRYYRSTQQASPLLKNNTNCTRCGGGGCVHCVGD